MDIRCGRFWWTVSHIYAEGSPNPRVVTQRRIHIEPGGAEGWRGSDFARLFCGRAIAGGRPGVGVSDERREQHPGYQEYGDAEQDHIDDVAYVVDDDGALSTQRFDRLGQLAVDVGDRLTALGSRPLERGQPLRLEAAQ